MRKKNTYLVICIAVLGIFNRCAQVGSLSGGEKDTIPPKLLEAIPALNSTRFNSDLITLRFDEYVQLKDLSNQLIVTPQLKTNIELTAIGKKIEISLKKEELKPNTTYRFFIGKAIADMTESNSIENFEYVFTTGDKLDTLKLSGNVSEAFTNIASGEVKVGLYFNAKNRDSIPFLEKPDYFARTNENGDFLLKYLPAEKFMVYGITDANKNGKYDGEIEKIAFLPSELNLKKDTSVKLKLFQEEASKVFIKKTNSPVLGLFQILLNKPYYTSVTALNQSDKTNISETFVGKLKDTISIYYKNIPDTLKLVLDYNNSKAADTLLLAIPKKKTKTKNQLKFKLNTKSDKLDLDVKMKLTFPVWMDTTYFDSSKIKLESKEDSSVAMAVTKGKWLDITTIELDTKLKEGASYTLKVDTNAFFDINRLSNDSVRVNFAVHSKSDFGKVRLNLKVNKKESYIIQLINDQSMVSKETFIQFSLSSSNAVIVDFTDVLPGTYSVKVIFDSNNNHKWDRGDLELKKLPEEVLINSKQIKVLSDWEIEEEIIIH